MSADAPIQTTPAEVSERRARGDAVQLLDVREGWELEICAIEGALHIPLGDLPRRFEEVRNGSGPLVVVCHHGGRSLQATRFLRSQGVARAINLQGGIDAWARQIDPTLKLY